MDIDLHIEQLVLFGFRDLDRHRVGDATARQLERLLAEGGLDPDGRNRTEVHARMLLPPGVKMRGELELGEALARAICGGLR